MTNILRANCKKGLLLIYCFLNIDVFLRELKALMLTTFNYLDHCFVFIVSYFLVI